MPAHRGFCNAVNIKPLTAILNTCSCGFVLLVLLVQLRLQGTTFFRQFPSNVVPLLMLISVLFHACVLAGIAHHGYQLDEKNESLEKKAFCETQAIILQFSMTLMLFGFMFISLLVYQGRRKFTSELDIIFMFPCFPQS